MIYVGIGSLSRCVGLWAMPKDDKKPEDAQWGCWAWVNGLRTKEKNDGSTLISEDLGHLWKASRKVVENSANHERQNIWEEGCHYHIKCTTPNELTPFMEK